MTWTYGGNPLSSSKDAVRLRIGDTDEADPLLQDEEISYFLQTEGGVELAAAAACEAVAAKFSRLADKAVGDLRLSLSQKAAAYERQAKSLRQSGSLRVAVPFAGGIEVAQKQSAKLDQSLVKPNFRIGMHDKPGTTPPATPTGQGGG